MDPHLSQISTLWTLVGQAHREEDPAVRDARQVLLARWGTSLSKRVADLPGGQAEFPLVSGNGRIVGQVVWLQGMESPEWKSSALSEHVWVMSHVAAADRLFLLVGHDLDLVTRWVAKRRGMLDGVELWSLDGDELERLA